LVRKDQPLYTEVIASHIPDMIWQQDRNVTASPSPEQKGPFLQTLLSSKARVEAQQPHPQGTPIVFTAQTTTNTTTRT